MRLPLLSAALLALSSMPLYAADAQEQETMPPQYVQQNGQPALDQQGMERTMDQNNVEEPDAEDSPAPGAKVPMPGEPVQPGMEQAPTTSTPTAPPIAGATPGATKAAPGQNTTAEPPLQPPSDTGDTNFDTVMLQGLNKVTARAQSIEAPIGSVIRYGTIEIIAHKCWKSSPEDRPENAALLEVSEIKQGEAPQRIFSGWMFSSTPALSSLEHPFYDINVISCSKGAVKP